MVPRLVEPMTGPCGVVVLELNMPPPPVVLGPPTAAGDRPPPPPDTTVELGGPTLDFRATGSGAFLNIP